MLFPYSLGQFVRLRDEVREWRETLDRAKERLDDRLQWHERERLVGQLVMWRNAALEFRLLTAVHVLDLAVPEARDGKMTYRDAMSRLKQVEEGYNADAGNLYALFLNEESAGTAFYGGFGDKVNAAFPSASDEINEANRCLAVEADTACVFHMMRAVEYAMRGLARGVGITTPAIPLEFQEWNSIIEQIESRTDKAPDRWPQPAKSNGRAFFRRAVSDLYAFKDDTRNILMHTRGGFYNRRDARSVVDRAREFFIRLAEQGVDENGTVNLLDPAAFDGP
jgi:hypothetical protein